MLKKFITDRAKIHMADVKRFTESQWGKEQSAKYYSGHLILNTPVSASAEREAVQCPFWIASLRSRRRKSNVKNLVTQVIYAGDSR